jgi:hypothetical protein
MKYIILSILFFLVIFPDHVQAKEGSEFINIVNPIRISEYTKDSVKSLEAEYEQVSKRNFSATWLISYDALVNQDISNFVKTMDSNQELGLFLEVTPKYSIDSGVTYNKSDSWHRARSIFLSGYTQSDRIKLIDQVFSKFKETFGVYPSSVGGWWIDSYSLEYMINKYNITANLGLADQFSTDGYQVWGGYWSTPFYPGKFHAGMPAANLDSKLNIVTLEWAPRDPLHGYSDDRDKASLYSTQDYFTLNIDDSYFKDLMDLYAGSHNNSFGQITVGLESDLDPEAYLGRYSKQMGIIDSFQKTNNYKVVNMRDFSVWYRGNFPSLSPSQVVEGKDLLNGSNDRAIWYQSPNYRIGLKIYPDQQKISVVDLRVYGDNFQEPYFKVPNQDLNLYINMPSVLDTMISPTRKWDIKTEGAINFSGDHDNFKVSDNRGEIFSFQNTIFYSRTKLPDFSDVEHIQIKKSNGGYVNTPLKHWQNGISGKLINSLTPEAIHFLKLTKFKLALVILIVLLLVYFLLIKISLKSKSKKTALVITPTTLIVLACIFWVNLHSRQFFVSQSEIDALEHLINLPQGKVLVFDRECLQCVWHSEFQPAVFINSRNYVSDISKQQVVQDSEILTVKDRVLGRQKIKDLKIKYIYLVKYESYVESLPFSPGDYNLEMIYENANATVWEVKSI